MSIAIPGEQAAIIIPINQIGCNTHSIIKYSEWGQLI